MEKNEENDLLIKKEINEIKGLTTFCYEKYLKSFLEEQKIKGEIIQPFELYEGPPEFLPLNTLIFIFQAGEEHRLRAIAINKGYLDIDGWKKDGKIVAKLLLEFYKSNNITSHDSEEELTGFCSQNKGVRGLFLFNKIIEIKYHSENDWITHGGVTNLFKGKQPYAQGFPYRYLNVEMVNKLINLILEKAENKEELKKFFGENKIEESEK